MSGSKQSSKKVPQRKHMLEKTMAVLTVFFIGGIVLYTIIPDESMKGMTIGLMSFLTIFVLYRLGI